MEVTMPTASIDRSVSEYVASFTKIEELQNEARDLLVKIKDIYLQIGEIASGGGRSARVGRPVGRPRGRRPGRPKGSGRKVGRPAKPSNGTRAPRGALKAAIHKVLAGGKALKPADIVKQLGANGFKTASNPRVFYTNVYLALKRDKAIKKTAEGFRLKAAAK
jgi:hypothetical protein